MGTACVQEPDMVRREHQIDPLELEFLVSHHVDAGTKPGSSSRTVNALNNSSLQPGSFYESIF